MKAAAFAPKLPAWHRHVDLGPRVLERRHNAKPIKNDLAASNGLASAIPISPSISSGQFRVHKAVCRSDVAAEALGFVVLSIAAMGGLLLHLLAGSQWMAGLPAFQSMIERVLGG